MSNLTSVFAALIISSFCFVGAIGPCDAFPGESGTQSLQKLMDNPVLQVKKKNKCIKVFECDYFAPATACSTPPCCKKGHWEKNCDVDKAQAPGTPKETPKDAPADTPLKDFCENMDKNGLAPFNTKCRGQFSGQPSCATFSTEGNGDYRCCCYYH